MRLLLDLPLVISIIIVAVLSVGISVLGLKLVRARIPRERLVENHEVAGFIFNAFGLVYAVLLAFVVFANWSDYDTSKKNVETEASRLQDIFMESQGFTEPVRNNVRHAILDYANNVYYEEWKTMEDGKYSPAAWESLQRLWSIYLTIDVKNVQNPAIYQESFKRLSEISEARRIRIFDVNDTNPPLIWIIVIIGSLISIGYTYLFGTKNLRAQYIMTSALALTNSLVLFLIYVLDHPFTGYNKITPEAFESIINLFNKVLTGS